MELGISSWYVVTRLMLRLYAQHSRIFECDRGRSLATALVRVLYGLMLVVEGSLQGGGHQGTGSCFIRFRFI